MINAQAICKEIKNGKQKQTILNNVSLTIKHGEFVSILGPSGAGKSTLLYCLSGLETVSKGEIVVRGESITTLSDEKKARFRFEHMGIIFQNFNLIPMITVKENITFVADMYKIVPDEGYLNELLRIVGLEEKTNTQVANLSGGQQQRVAIARALFMKPQILFADEPTGNLDSRTAEVITSLLETVNRELGTTIVQVTHAEELAFKSGRIIRMKDGEIV